MLFSNSLCYFKTDDAMYKNFLFEVCCTSFWWLDTSATKMGNSLCKSDPTHLPAILLGHHAFVDRYDITLKWLVQGWGLVHDTTDGECYLKCKYQFLCKPQHTACFTWYTDTCVESIFIINQHMHAIYSYIAIIAHCQHFALEALL